MQPTHVLTINMQIVLYYPRWMSGNLAGVRALVADLWLGNLQAPIVRVLVVDSVPRVAAVRLVADRQQLQLLLADQAPHPGDLQWIQSKCRP